MNNSKIFGVLCSYGPSHGASLPNFNSLSNHLRDLSNTFSEKEWSVVVFRIEDVLKRKKIIWGWSRSEGVWRRVFSPTPNICLIRKSILTKNELEILRWMEDECDAQFINHPNLIEILSDRWRTNQILMSHPNLISKTPDCFPLVESKKISQLQKEKVNFVAMPRFASSPQKYITTEFIDDSIKCDFFYKKKIKSVTFKNPNSVIATIQKNIDGAVGEIYKTPFVHKGHSVSLRCLLTKTKKWEHQGTLLRISRKGIYFGPFTTVGNTTDYKKVLEDFFGDSVDSIIFQANNISKNIVELLDERTHSGACELSVDIMFSSSFEPIIFGISSQGALFSASKIGNPEFKKKILTTLSQSAEQKLLST